MLLVFGVSCGVFSRDNIYIYKFDPAVLRSPPPPMHVVYSHSMLLRTSDVTRSLSRFPLIFNLQCLFNSPFWFGWLVGPQVWDAKNCVVIKRSMATGYAGLDNPVFYKVCQIIDSGSSYI